MEKIRMEAKSMTGHKGIPAAALLLILLIPINNAFGDSAGLASGTMTTANACGFGVGYFGGILGLGDNFTSFIGTLNYGFSQYTEGRAKLGIVDAEGTSATLFLGADMKYQLLDHYDAVHPSPLDLALGGFFEWASFDPNTVLQLGGNVIGSIPYRFTGGQRLIPYGSVNVRLERLSANGNSNTNLELGLNIGAKFEMSSDMSFYGELQIDGNTGLFLGTEIRAF
jgi:hypothetical protein